MNKKTIRIAGWALGLSMAVAGIGLASEIQHRSLEVGATESTYEKIASLTAGDQVLIVAYKGTKYYQLPTANGSSSAPTALEVTVTGGNTIAGDFDANLFTVEKDQDNWKFKNGEDDYLYCTSTNNGIRIGSNDNRLFTVTLENDGKDYYSLENVATSRYVGVYNTQDWRCYTSKTQSNYGSPSSAQQVMFFKKAASKWTVSFDLQGHGSSVDSQSITDGGKVAEPSDPTAAGFTFGGWFKESTCDNAWDFENDTVSEATTLYAKWTANGTAYTVTDSLTNASLSSTAEVLEDAALNLTITASEHYTLPENISITMGGSAFTNFTYTRGEGNRTATLAIAAGLIKGNLVVSGAAIEDAQYTITYKAGDHGSGSDYQYENYSGTYPLVSFASKGFVAADGYRFVKWEIAGVQYAEGADYMLNSNVVATAVYEETITYTIVTDPSTLTDGTTFVLVYETSGSYYVSNGLSSGHALLQAKTSATTFSNGISSGSTLQSSEAQVFTLEGEEDAWKIKYGDAYLKFTGTSNGNDGFDTKANASTFSVTMKENYILFTCTSETGKGRVWRLYPSSKDMRNYATNSGVGDVYMFAHLAPEPNIESIDVTGTPSKATQYAGEEFDYSGLTFTVNYDNDTSKVISGSKIDWSALVAGGHPTGDYNGTAVTVNSVSVVEDTVDHIVATVSKDYFVGETITKSDIVLKQVWDSGKETTVDSASYAFADYEFLYSDAPSGGKTKDDKVFNISYGGKSCELTVKVSREAHSTPVDSMNHTGSEFATAGIVSSYTADQTAVVDGITFNVSGYIYNNKLSLSSNKSTAPGSVVNTTAYPSGISNVTLDGASPDIQLSVDGKTGWTDLASADTNAVTYRFLKIFFKNTAVDSYVNINSITVSLHGESAESLANYVMYEDTANQCESKFGDAKNIFNNLSSAEKTLFMTDSGHVISSARARFLAWAAHEGKTIELEEGDYVVKPSANVAAFANGNIETNSFLPLALTIASVGVTVSGGIFFLARRRRNEE